MTGLEYRSVFNSDFTAYGLVEANIDLFTDRFDRCVSNGDPLDRVVDVMERTFVEAARSILDRGDDQVSDDEYLAYREFAFRGWKSYVESDEPRIHAKELVSANRDRLSVAGSGSRTAPSPSKRGKGAKTRSKATKGRAKGAGR